MGVGIEEKISCRKSSCHIKTINKMRDLRGGEISEKLKREV